VRSVSDAPATSRFFLAAAPPISDQRRKGVIVFIAFLTLTALTLALRDTRAAALRRNPDDWTLDASGLLVQGALIPLLQSSLVYAILLAFVPQLKGSLDISSAGAFLLNFVAVDYIYYWNHRLLHSNALWRAHAVHHTPEQVDVLITSRNTLWSPLVIVYVWANGFFLFILKDPAPYLLAASLTASLDLWRHTSFSPRPDSAFHRTLALFLITPHEHNWHHSSDQSYKNFGANLSVWDRIHGSYFSPAHRPLSFGIRLDMDLKRKLLFPFRANQL